MGWRALKRTSRLDRRSPSSNSDSSSTPKVVSTNATPRSCNKQTHPHIHAREKTNESKADKLSNRTHPRSASSLQRDGDRRCRVLQVRAREQQILYRLQRARRRSFHNNPLLPRIAPTPHIIFFLLLFSDAVRHYGLVVRAIF